MHTIKNVSHGRHQVRTLDQGLVFLDPGDVLTAQLDRSYARIVGRSMSLSVADAPEGAVAGLEKASPGTSAQETGSTHTEQRQNGPNGDDTPPADDAGREEWAKYAEAKGIEVKKNWGINRIKTELAQQ